MKPVPVNHTIYLSEPDPVASIHTAIINGQHEVTGTSPLHTLAAALDDLERQDVYRHGDTIEITIE